MKSTETNPNSKKPLWPLRMLGILTSRWMYVVAIALAFVAVRTQSHALFVVLYIATGLIVALMLIASIPVLWHICKAWSRFPNTPHYKEWTARRANDNDNKNKNKVKIK